ncbi:MAG: ankyrin repeat domain-containing protein [Acidobacteria bacterium]|nr:ankyrin repeat domain-containing protein [Acidobacteriota bacterium]
MSVIAALKAGDLDAVIAALDASPEAVDERDEQGVPALMWSLYIRRQDLTDLLLARGAAVDFFAACALGRGDTAAAFLNGRPDLISSPSPDGWTALHLAAFFGHTPLAAALLERGADPLARSANPMANLPIHAAAAAQQPALVALLLQAGTPANSTQHGGYTPLHSACQNNDEESIALLLAHGGDLAHRADDGRTPASLRPSA